MAKRVFLIVLDSFGVGELPDAAAFGDAGANTLRSIAASPAFKAPVLEQMGLFNIDGVACRPGVSAPSASFARMTERSMGKDTTIGHWEIAGIVSPTPMPTYPNGFPADVVEAFEKAVGRKVLCNKPYSGTQALVDFGEQHMKTGDLILYTSADSVFQVAAHEEVVPLEELYRICQIARDMLTASGKHAVGRVIARPFLGHDKSDFQRTTNRHDFSLTPPKKTMLDLISGAGMQTIGVGKIYDIFAGVGVTEQLKSKGNFNGMEITLELADRDFEGLAFVNLVDFDMLYGHRNNIDGYAAATTEFDGQLAQFIQKMRPDDLLMITADHGCDPGFLQSTDHSREYTPMLAYGAGVRPGVNLHTRASFADIAATTCEFLGVPAALDGESYWPEIRA